jgi:hypothetical protein
MEGKSSRKQQIGGKKQRQTHFCIVPFEREKRMGVFWRKNAIHKVLVKMEEPYGMDTSEED